ncbi:hypothetical protein DL96DRAFT_1575712 [Flagelloscypha sp. PMI_526]|nr:hypothetical protein DL96DRAFT_1575712 [Flagelloscypha sp. PMI_526]
MISGLSKSITLYLAPVLMLTTLFLNSFSYFAPSGMLHDQVALLTVTPQRRSSKPDHPRTLTDPPCLLVFLALALVPITLLRSNAPGLLPLKPSMTCTFSPTRLPETLLSPPTSSPPSLIALSLSCALVFFISFALISFRHKLGGFGSKMENPLVQRLSAWVGFFGFVIGLATYLIVRMWFEKAILDFNSNIALQGPSGPQLVAQSGNGFTMIWVGYAFYAVPLIISLDKLNVKATKDA